MLESVKFFIKYIAKPRMTGSVCPSSRFLARRMVKGVSLRDSLLKRKEIKPLILELGPGTGPVTDVLVKSGYVNACDIVCVEFDKNLSERLAQKYGAVQVVNGSAEDIGEILGEDVDRLATIISSLPLLSLPNDMVKKILSEVERLLPVGGRFIQFTYNLKKDPNKLGFKNMKHINASKEYLNIPPARVDIFEKVD